MNRREFIRRLLASSVLVATGSVGFVELSTVLRNKQQSSSQATTTQQQTTILPHTPRQRQAQRRNNQLALQDMS